MKRISVFYNKIKFFCNQFYLKQKKDFIELFLLIRLAVWRYRLWQIIKKSKMEGEGFVFPGENEKHLVIKLRVVFQRPLLVLAIIFFIRPLLRKIIIPILMPYILTGYTFIFNSIFENMDFFILAILAYSPN